MEIHAGHLLMPFSSYCSTEGTPLIANHGTPPKPPAGGAQSGTTSPTPHDITTRHGATAPQPGTALDGSTRLSRHHYRPSKKTPPEPQNTTNAFSTGHTKQRAGWMDSLPTPPSLHASRLSQPPTGLPSQIPSKKKTPRISRGGAGKLTAPGSVEVCRRRASEPTKTNPLARSAPVRRRKRADCQ